MTEGMNGADRRVCKSVSRVSSIPLLVAFSEGSLPVRAKPSKNPSCGSHIYLLIYLPSGVFPSSVLLLDDSLYSVLCMRHTPSA